MNFGLQQRDIDEICSALKRYPQIQSAVVFGSRAKGNYKQGSDVDIAISGSDIDYSCVNQLSSFLNEETALPYFFDIVHLENITEVTLLEHINRVGIALYCRQKTQRTAY